MKIQNVIYKILIFLFFINPLTEPKVFAQAHDEVLLQTADSLFVNRHYTESFKVYDQLYQDGKYTPAMLLKMAFIQEGLGEYSEALYYLNEYYLFTSDEKVIEKMQQLSNDHHLRGYEYSDYDLFLNFVRKYRYIVLYGLLTLTLAGLAYFAFAGKRQATKPYGLGVAYVILLGLLYFLANYSIGPRQAIITDDNTYIMSGPSAGAEVVHVSKKGHRVKIDGQNDVWTEIEWEGEPAFVRQSNLRFINP